MADKKIAIGLGAAVAAGLGIWLLTRRKPAEELILSTGDLAKIRTEADRLGRPLTIEETNVYVYTEEELKSGVLAPGAPGFEKRVIVPAVEAGLISMTEEDIAFWLQQKEWRDAVYIPWQELEAKAAEISEILGMDIGASEMREAARIIQLARWREEAEAMGIKIEETDPETGEVIGVLPWVIAYEQAKVAEAAALGIPTTGRTRTDVVADLEAVEAGRITVAETQTSYVVELQKKIDDYVEAMRRAGATEEEIARRLIQGQMLEIQNQINALTSPPAAAQAAATTADIAAAAAAAAAAKAAQTGQEAATAAAAADTAAKAAAAAWYLYYHGGLI